MLSHCVGSLQSFCEAFLAIPSVHPSLAPSQALGCSPWTIMTAQSHMSEDGEAGKYDPFVDVRADATLRNERSPAFLGVPLESSLRHSTDTLSDISTYSLSNGPDGRSENLFNDRSTQLQSDSPGHVRGLKGQMISLWLRNKGLLLVVLSQLFGAVMSLTTRLLETDGPHGAGMHPFQV